MNAEPIATSLAALEPRLRPLLPALLYAQVWNEPTPAHLQRAFAHLRTLQRDLYGYVPRHVAERRVRPGEVQFAWQSGALLFTDLVGFTALMVANAHQGTEGARQLLHLLNTYFTTMLRIIGMSGGHLLEFTGDALLAEFHAAPGGNETACAVRAGLRMQRAMANFAHIETPPGVFSLQMRVGIHTGRFITADIGTPFRMDHVLMGADVMRAKLTESTSIPGRVNLSAEAHHRVRALFHCEPGQHEYWLVVDDLAEQDLGAYDILPTTRRLPRMLLTDRSAEGLLQALAEAVGIVEPLSSYLPLPILKLLLECPDRREVQPDFPQVAVLFVNLLGLAERADETDGNGVADLVHAFSRLFALINAAVETHDGVLKKVTYHLVGADVMIYFGAPIGHTDDPRRAALTALTIRDLVAQAGPFPVACKIGLTYGPALAVEIGEPHGRREYNVLGHTVNTAARLMYHANHGQILLNAPLHAALPPTFTCHPLGQVIFKGSSQPQMLYELHTGP